MIDLTSLSYLPTVPKSYRPAIGMIGCGNISGTHLESYRAVGYNVVALCDIDPERSKARRDEFYPQADVMDDYHELLARPDIDVVDIATHVNVRPGQVRDALNAGKHVLSQKPFVLDLDEGEALAKLADERGRLLAVNQNGRWAPHHSWLLAAEKAGVLGKISSADWALYWPHDDDFKDHPVFSKMADLILYDFGIHWFDVVAQLFASSEPAASVYATLGKTVDQEIVVPTSAQVVITYPNASATILFRGSSHRARGGSYRVDGTAATVVQNSDDELGSTQLDVYTDQGKQIVGITGDWYTNGMRGTMGELLCAIEEGRKPSNEARASLPGLALCFAAMTSAREGRPVDPRTTTKPPPSQ